MIAPLNLKKYEGLLLKNVYSFTINNFTNKIFYHENVLKLMNNLLRLMIRVIKYNYYRSVVTYIGYLTCIIFNSKRTAISQIMDPRFVTSNFMSYPPLEQSYFPFYPYYCCNNAHFMFYGWKNELPHSETYKYEPLAPTDQPKKAQPTLKEPQEEKFTNSNLKLKRNEKQMGKIFKKPRVEENKHSPQYLQNRNIVPNLTCNILSFIRRMNRSGRIVDRIILKLNQQNQGQNLSVKKYYSYQHYIKENMTDYKGKDVIYGLISSTTSECTCFTLEEQMKYNQVTRILIANYLEEYLLSDILSSNRVSKKNMKDYLKGRRILSNILTGKAEEPL